MPLLDWPLQRGTCPGGGARAAYPYIDAGSAAAQALLNRGRDGHSLSKGGCLSTAAAPAGGRSCGGLCLENSDSQGLSNGCKLAFDSVWDWLGYCKMQLPVL